MVKIGRIQVLSIKNSRIDTQKHRTKKQSTKTQTYGHIKIGYDIITRIEIYCQTHNFVANHPEYFVYANNSTIRRKWMWKMFKVNVTHSEIEGEKKSSHWIHDSTAFIWSAISITRRKVNIWSSAILNIDDFVNGFSFWCAFGMQKSWENFHICLFP